MKSWTIYIFVQGSIIAAASTGLGLQLRLVRFFDLGWALWAMASSFVSVLVANTYSSPVLGIICGTLTATILGVFEDAVIFRGVLTSYVPYQALERFSFSGSLAAYLALASLTEVLGLRDRITVPSSNFSWQGFSLVELSVVVSSLFLLTICAIVRYSSWSLPLRAVLDNSRGCPAYGMRVHTLAGVIGGLAGALTGVAASSFGLLYFAHSSMGFSLMLLAVVPVILIGPRNSHWIALVAVVTVAIIAAVRFYFGDSASQFLVQAAILVLLLTRPTGVLQGQLREV